MFLVTFETPSPTLTNVQIFFFIYRKLVNPHYKMYLSTNFIHLKAPGFPWGKPSYL